MLEIRKEEQPTSGWSKGAYESIYDGVGIRHRDSFYRWILRLLHPKPGRRLLDVACGEGSLPRLATLAGLEAHGLDLSEVAIRIAVRETPAALVVSDGERLPYADASFDYVTSIGSLEHYLHPPQGVKEIARVLAPDGLALVLLPNTFGLLDNGTARGGGTDGGEDGQVRTGVAHLPGRFALVSEPAEGSDPPLAHPLHPHQLGQLFRLPMSPDRVEITHRR